MRKNIWVANFERVNRHGEDYVEETIPFYSNFTYIYSTLTNRAVSSIQQFASRKERLLNEVRKLDALKDTGLVPEVIYPDFYLVFGKFFDYSLLLNDFPFGRNGRVLLVERDKRDQRDYVRRGIESLAELHYNNIIHGDALWKNSYEVNNRNVGWCNFSTVVDESDIRKAMAYDYLCVLLNLKKDGNVDLMNWLAENLWNMIGDAYVGDEFWDMLSKLSNLRMWIGRRLVPEEFKRIKDLSSEAISDYL